MSPEQSETSAAELKLQFFQVWQINLKLALCYREVQGHANPNFHGTKQNTDEVMGCCRPSAFGPFTHSMISFTLDMDLLSFWRVKTYEYDK